MAFLLVLFTALYNIGEGAIAIWFGLEDESISLFGFGLDSLIEVSASVVMLWRLQIMASDSSQCIAEREAFVKRFIGVTFLLLAAYVLFHSIEDLWIQHHTDSSWVGILIAVLSLIVMPGLALWKIKLSREIGSEALAMEAKETIACSILSFILLMGLGLQALFGWWWADPVAALVMVPWLVREGWAGVRNQSCCG